MTSLIRMYLLSSGFCLALIAGAKAAPPATTKPADEAPSNHKVLYKASCTVRITFDPRLLPLDAESIGLLFGSGTTKEPSDYSKLDYSPKLEFIPQGTSSVSLLPQDGRSESGNPGSRSNYSYAQAPTARVPATTATPAARGEATARSSEAQALTSEAQALALEAQSVASEARRLRETAAESNGPRPRFSGRVGQNPWVSRPERKSATMVSDTEAIVVGRLIVRADSSEKAVRAITDAIERVEKAINKFSDMQIDELKSSLTDAHQEEELFLKSISDLQQARKKILAASPISDISRDSLLEASRRLELQLQDAAVKQETLQARSATLTQYLSTDIERAQASLKKLEKRLEELKSSSESERAKEEAATSIKQAQATLSMLIFFGKSPDKLDGLMKQFSEVSVDLVETQAQLVSLEKKCEKLRELLVKSDDYDIQIGIQLPLAVDAYQNAVLRGKSLQAQLKTIRPGKVWQLDPFDVTKVEPVVSP